MRDYRTTRKDIVPTYLPDATTLPRRYVPSAGRTLAAACEDQGMSFTNRCVCHDMTYYREDGKGMSNKLRMLDYSVGSRAERLHRTSDVIDRTDYGSYGEGPIDLVSLNGYHFD